MAQINILTSEVYNLISAGEVVERPASVVKELVENSIDAGATNITIDIEEGGIKKIRVCDNGCGIENGEIKKAFYPHATSKLKTEADLDSISTLGFRGEALASISAVSKVEITSKTKDDEVGSTVEVVGGTFTKEDQKGCPQGTYVDVNELFFNVPARAKFLKKPKSEEAEITNLVSRFILANPKISFKYSADKKIIYQSTGSSVEDALHTVYGKDCLSNVLFFDKKYDNIQISGYVGKPTYNKPNKTYQTLVLNGRYIINQTVSSAVFNACSEFLMTRQYPFFVMYITLPTADVDVNVHPNKMDVRFEPSLNIYYKVFETITRTVHKLDFVPTEHTEVEKRHSVAVPSFQVKFSEATAQEKQQEIVSMSTALFSHDGVASSKPQNFVYEKLKELQNQIINTTTGEVVTAKPTQTQFETEKEFQIVGKLFNTYLVLEYDNSMFLVDQHACHERYKYDKLLKEVDQGDIVVQDLMIPYVFTTNSTEADYLQDNLPIIRSLGFDIEEFGKDSFKISSVPNTIAEIDLKSFTTEILSDSNRNVSNKSSSYIKDKLAQMACKSAVKAGNDLSHDEIRILLQNISNEKTPLYCPHGRPAMIKITKDELEKWFKRQV